MLWLVLAILGIASLGWELKRRQAPPPMDPGLFMRFGLTPGERHGEVWPATHASGDAMVVTVTSYGELVLAYSILETPAVRLAREGTSVTIAGGQTVTSRGTGPMVEMSISTAALPAFTVLISSRGAKAVLAWSKTAH